MVRTTRLRSTPADGRPRPAVVLLTRSLAKWNASRDRSAMNFWAESDRRRFLMSAHPRRTQLICVTVGIAVPTRVASTGK